MGRPSSRGKVVPTARPSPAARGGGGGSSPSKRPRKMIMLAVLIVATLAGLVIIIAIVGSAMRPDAATTVAMKTPGAQSLKAAIETGNTRPVPNVSW